MTNFPIIELDTIGSTNNYAMQLIDANKAHHGLTIVANQQTAGKGQRGRTWIDEPGKSLLMSIIIYPSLQVAKQFEFNARVAVMIANVLQKLFQSWRVAVKWPNDIIINDKKAGGILIENTIRGQNWTHSVVGIGMNVNQDDIPTELTFATSLRKESGIAYSLPEIRERILDAILSPELPIQDGDIFGRYNACLYKRGKIQKFSNQDGVWEATIVGVHPDGSIELRLYNGNRVRYYHGQILWEWEKQV